MKTHIIKTRDYSWDKNTDTDDVTVVCGHRWDKDWLITLVAIGQVGIALGYRYWSRNQRQATEDWCQNCIRSLEKEYGPGRQP